MNGPLAENRSLKGFVLGYKKYFDKDITSIAFSNRELLGSTLFSLSQAATLKALDPLWNKDPALVQSTLRERAAGTIDLPFPMVILESEFGFMEFLMRSYDGKGSVPVLLYSIVCREDSPGQYSFDAFARHSLPAGETRIENCLPDDRDMLRGLMCMVFNNRKAHFGVESRPGTVKIKGRSGTRYEKVRPIVHVVLDGEYQPGFSEDGEPIDWQHSWMVRGHWRICIGLGKDREGEYCVAGFTWVKEHKKGSGPLIKKTRITEIKNAHP